MPKLLIVDDEEGILREVKDFFDEEGYQAIAIDTGEGGIRLIEQETPDLVLLDLKLPDISGLQVLNVLRKSFPQCKVLVNTGYMDQSLMDQAAGMGCDGFLCKPFNLIRLKEEVDRILNKEV